MLTSAFKKKKFSTIENLPGGMETLMEMCKTKFQSVKSRQF